MESHASFFHHRHANGTHRTPWRAIVAGFLFVSLIGPRWAAADVTVKLPDGATLIWVPAPIPTPSPSPTPTASPTAVPSTKPSPTPSASPSPSPSGSSPAVMLFTRPTLPENMQEVAPDVWETTAAAFADQKAGVLQFNIPVAYGCVLDVDFDRAINVPGGWTSKIKSYRAWAEVIGGSYNIYFGSDNGSYAFIWVENIATAIRWLIRLPATDGTYHHEHYRFVYPSGMGKTDGRVEYTIDGKSVISAPARSSAADVANPGGRWKVDGPASHLENIHCIQIDTPSWNPPSGSFMRVKNIRYVLKK